VLVRGHGERLPAFDFGVADPPAAPDQRAAEQAESKFGPIDVWVNVAFTSVFAPFWEIKPDEFRRVTEVSYLGFVHGTMAALARMRPRDRGTIIQVGSALGYRGIPLQSAYCGAKHAINGFTESVRCELLHDKSHVRITVVQMPAVNTPQFSWVLSRLPRRPQPVPPIYQPEVGMPGRACRVRACCRPAPVLRRGPRRSRGPALSWRSLGPGLLSQLLPQYIEIGL